MNLFYNKQPNLKGLDINNYKVWENDSLPLGNGYFGASVFGYINKDRIQITENSLANPYSNLDPIPSRNCGLQSFCDIFITSLNKGKVSSYKRSLDLDKALFTLSYKQGKHTYEREIFASYPNHCLVIRLSTENGNLMSYNFELSLPFVGEHCVSDKDCFKRSGEVFIKDNSIIIEGKMHFYNIDYYGKMSILSKSGKISSSENSISVLDSDEIICIFSCGTNYKLDESVFLEEVPSKKLKFDEHLHSRIYSYVDTAASNGYQTLFAEHLSDYSTYYSRVSLSLGDEHDECIPTNQLLSDYKKGNRSSYLEALLFQYGRYLLISSSRIGALPANLQGTWSAYKSSPWSAGYWHNINVQMNYWPSEVTNLSEMFIPYSDYSIAYMRLARKCADDYIMHVNPNEYEKDNNGYYVGTGAWPYTMDKFSPASHSGPGTGGFTSLLFYEHYAFTKDKKYLKTIAYPRMYEMSVFLYKNLFKYNDTYLVKNSASPENIEKGGEWCDYHRTVGCAFDQQMVYENFLKTIELSEELNITNDLFIEKIKSILHHLEPVLIGDSGQVKEYREEHKYGEIGELHHRHVSQLVGLYPGTIINQNSTYEKAAEYTLNRRGDKSTGWATAHRLCLWTRIKNAKRAKDLINNLISKNIMRNLWDKHPPFQIDGNFGYTAGVAEMLIQSHEGYIDLLPCLPLEWANGYFKGLKARGNYVVDCEFSNGILVNAFIYVQCDGALKIRNKNYKYIYINDTLTICEDKFIELNVKCGDIILIKNYE